MAPYRIVCCVVWYRMGGVWHGVISYGVVCGILPHGVVWCHIVWVVCGVVSYRMGSCVEWYRIVRGGVWCGIVS